jgi:hypothetical protein
LSKGCVLSLSKGCVLSLSKGCILSHILSYTLSPSKGCRRETCKFLSRGLQGDGRHFTPQHLFG